MALQREASWVAQNPGSYKESDMVPWTFGQTFADTFHRSHESALDRRHQNERDAALWAFQEKMATEDWKNRFKMASDQYGFDLSKMRLGDKLMRGRTREEYGLKGDLMGQEYKYRDWLETQGLGRTMDLNRFNTQLGIEDYTARLGIAEPFDIRREERALEDWKFRFDRTARENRLVRHKDLLTGKTAMYDPLYDDIPESMIDVSNYPTEKEIFSQSAAGRGTPRAAPPPPEISALQLMYAAGDRLQGIPRLGRDALFAPLRVFGWEPYKEEMGRFTRKNSLWGQYRQRSPLERAKKYYEPEDELNDYNSFWNLTQD